MASAVLGLGTNLGDRLASLRRGVRALRAAPDRLRVTGVSPIYQSDALTPPDAPPDWHLPYLNLAVAVEFAGATESLLRFTKSIETALGRSPRARWAPRELDIDILAAGDLVRTDELMTIPHPALADRPFALLPLRDLTPGWRFPVGEWAGWSAADAAARWRGDPDRVPFRTRRTTASLTELVGIVNLTPDSFSDGGAWTDPDRAVAQARKLVAEGATVLDLGAESTRPGATPISADQEWQRLEDTLRQVLAWRGESNGSGPVVSVDTRSPDVATRALECGVDWINDVSGFADSQMIEATAGSRATLVAMHSLDVPPRADRVIDPGDDPIAAILDWGRERIDRLGRGGVGPDRIILDPGLGFGKTPDQCAAIVRRAGELSALGCPILIGHSRKRFLAAWFGGEGPDLGVAAARDPETAAISQLLAAEGVDYLRVHDVAGSRRAIRVAAFSGGRWEPGGGPPAGAS